MRTQPILFTIILIGLLLVAPAASLAQNDANRTYLPVVISNNGASAEATDELTTGDAIQAADQAEDRRTQSARGERTVTVMTRNLYFGADLALVVSATTPQEFVVAASNLYLAAVASDIPGRMATVAAEIKRAKPLLVGLQEVTLWRTGPAFNPAPATAIQYDFLQLLLDELTRRGLPYEAVAVVAGFDAESPTGLGFDVRLTIRDVLLARADRQHGNLTLSNIQTGRYATNLSFPTAVGPLLFARQWAAVDAQIGNQTLRFITTHLESLNPQIQVAQAQELLAGPANTPLPTILVGDLNSQPGDSGGAAATVLAVGFTDGWGVVQPDKPGFTCCHAPDLRNAAATLDHRIDLILIRGELEAEAAAVIGNRPRDKTASGLWPSDHAGLVVKVELQ